MVEAYVGLDGITKRFGEVVAVDDITLSVREKEMFFLLGPSGCGKTTSLRIIAGLERPDAGTIEIDGKDVTKVPPHKRNTSMVFQRWALFPHKTIFDNVAFGLKIRKLPKTEIRKKVTEALELVNLQGYESRYPSQLSGGQQQRIALARALVVEPAVILLDEPLSNLDLNLRNRMRSEIVKLQRKLGTTAVYVTHDQTEALVMADRIALMNQGKIVEVSTPFNLYENPKTEFAAGFIGDRNLIEGAVCDRTDKWTVVATKSGMRIYIDQEEKLPTGTQVRVAVNPEAVALGDKETLEPEKGVNYYRGKIEELIYLGSVLRYKVMLDDGEMITKDELNIRLRRQFKTGDRVFVLIDPKECVCVRHAGT